MHSRKSNWLTWVLLGSLFFCAIQMANSSVDKRNQKLALEQEKAKNLADLEEITHLSNDRMKQLSAKWKEKFNKREEQVIKQDTALIQLHGDLMTMSAAFLYLRMKLPITPQLDRDALILADETLGNRHITFDELVDQKWLQNRGENPVSALHYENYQF